MSMAAVVTTQVAGSGTLVPATKEGSWSDVAGSVWEGVCSGGSTAAQGVSGRKRENKQHCAWELFCVMTFDFVNIQA